MTTGTCIDNYYACGLSYVSTNSDSTRLSNPLNAVLQGSYSGQKSGLTTFGTNYLFTASGSPATTTVSAALATPRRC